MKNKEEKGLSFLYFIYWIITILLFYLLGLIIIKYYV